MKRFTIEIGIETEDDSLALEDVHLIASGLRKDAEMRVNDEAAGVSYVLLVSVYEE